MNINPTDDAHPSGKYHLLDDIHPDFTAGYFAGVYLLKIKYQNQ
jgi:hypothetical protein